MNKELKYYINKLRQYLSNSTKNSNNELECEIQNFSSLIFSQKTQKKFTKVKHLHEN